MLRFRVNRALEKDFREVKLCQRKELVIDRYPTDDASDSSTSEPKRTVKSVNQQNKPTSKLQSKKPYTKEELDDPLNNLLYVGHLANSKEAEATQGRINKCKAGVKREQMTMRHMLLNAKVSTIEAMYQSDRIDPKQYAGELKSAVNRDIFLAKALQQLGRKPECLRVIQRLKNMKMELADLKKNGLIQ